MAEWMAVPGWSTLHLISPGVRAGQWQANCGRVITAEPYVKEPEERRCCTRCINPRGASRNVPRVFRRAQ